MPYQKYQGPAIVVRYVVIKYAFLLAMENCTMVMFAKTSGQGYKIYWSCIVICFRNCIQLILGRTCTKRSLLFPDQSSCDDPRIPKASHAQRARKWPLEYNLNDLSILTADIFFPRIPLRK